MSDESSLLQWHVEQMLEFCDEVRVCTRPEWVPIIQNMEMNVKLIVKEPSTMSDAIQYMVGSYTDTVVVGMPDTFILNSNSNIYKELMKEEKADLVVGVWACRTELKGRVGQVAIANGTVIGSEDKVEDCDYPDMWGTLLFRNNLVGSLDPKLDHPGKQLKSWISEGIKIRAVKLSGEYMDIGTLKGLKELYREMDK